MNNQEFLNLLSRRAKNIVYNYEIITNKKPIKVILDKYSALDTSFDNMYIIHVNQNNSIDIMEYDFLHEFLHCVQKDEGFPSVYYNNIKYKMLAETISSMVLDLNVIKRLNAYGYPYNSNELKENINNIRNLMNIAKINSEVKIEMHETNQYFNICFMIAFCRLEYDNGNELIQLLQIVQKNASDFYKTQSIIYDTIIKYGYNIPKQVYKIFKTLIRGLKLYNYVRIS